MVGAAPVCPPERPRSGVSIRKEHIPTCKEGFSIHKRCMLTPKHVCAFADGCALVGRHGRAHRRRPYQPLSNPFTTQSPSFLPIGEHLTGNLMTRTIREMVGAAPVYPPERPRRGVSIRKGHVPTRKGGVSIHKRCMLTPKHVCVFADGCALAGRRGRAHRHRPYQPPSNPFTTQSSLVLCIGELFAGNLETRSHTRNGGGGACVPARTSAQRRFHPQRAYSYT